MNEVHPPATELLIRNLLFQIRHLEIGFKIPRTKILDFDAMERKLLSMLGLDHEGGSLRIFLDGLAILANLIPYQRRAINGGKCAIEVEGGKLPTDDWFVTSKFLPVVDSSEFTT
ncbi:hypothetical protein IH992_26635 [Candidatus Poribacteria bacterium]|nr:hypothetical protein [Candidatus Poribacteria bacterium]